MSFINAEKVRHPITIIMISNPSSPPPFTVDHHYATPITDQEVFLEFLSETHNNILACSRILRNYAINSLPDNPTDEAIEARVTEIRHYLTQYPPDIHVVSLYVELDVKGKAYIDRSLFIAWIALKNEHAGGTMTTDNLPRLHLLTFLMKTSLLHEEAKVVTAIFADGPTSKYIKGMAAEVALTGDQGEIWAVFEAGIGCLYNYQRMSHLVLLAQDQSRRYITQENVTVLADLAAGKWEEFPSFPQTPPAGEFPKRCEVFEDSTAAESDDDDDEEDAQDSEGEEDMLSPVCCKSRIR
ncbi:uncharacterized protein BJ212DRAFT_1481648 [Suillus subaureus]|uniref:Uncharacterized protein n=1 Tax=Suillus subaureus TaxID=48587 RepID=A0A9P7E9B3_9AGAM|nr:uncharacterized protein BJ212DRAFT_1481648 [Suillus subaureus]KAG1815122.1 hypothetical protein BJ212DRAFT_1481648 [Suillus subaureus]